MFLASSTAPRRRSGCLPFFLIVLGLALGLATGVILPPAWRTGVAGFLPAKLATLGQPTPTPTPVPTPVPTPTPTPPPTPTPLPKVLVIPPKSREVARLYNGIQVHSTFDVEPGRQAALERETPDSYALDIQLQVKVPTAAHAADEITRSAPDLLTAFPKFGSLLEKAEVSKFFFGIYQNKTELLRQNLTHLDALLARDVFYDTDTILEIQDPDTKRKALLIQSDMDVDSDGSDADRLLDIDTSDPHFQPLTSYKWPRRTAALNPLLAIYRDRLNKLENDARTAVPPRRGAQLAIDSLRNDVYQLEHYSSLIARADPFVVLPGFMARASGHPFQPKLGDYIVVLANNRLYPAIFGDIGPSDQAGEASLRMAQAVDPRATAERSPVDDLKITYLVFPGTADQPAGPPDLGKIRQRCQALVNEIGGSKLDLYEWANLIPPPTPTPGPTSVISPTPVPSSISPSPSPTPSIKPAPSASVAATVIPGKPTTAATPKFLAPSVPTPSPSAPKTLTPSPAVTNPAKTGLDSGQ